MLRLRGYGLWLMSTLAAAHVASAQESVAPEDVDPGAPAAEAALAAEPAAVATEAVGVDEPTSVETEEVVVDEPAGPPARDKASFVFSEDFEVRWYKSPELLRGFEDHPRVLDWFEQVNRFTIGAGYKRWSFYTQLDEVALTSTSHFLDDVRVSERELLAPGVWSPLIPGAFEPATHGFSGWDLFSRNVFFNLEKLRVVWAGKDVNVTLGDTYLAWGRGLALSVQRNVEIDIDSSIQGVKVEVRPGLWDVTGFFGQLNRQQVLQDNRNLGVYGDKRHTIGGFRVERYGIGPVNLGAHGVVYNFVRDTGWKAGFENLKSTPDAVVGGGTLEAIGLGPTDWYVEANGYAYPSAELFGGGEHKPGYAIYGSGAFYGGRTTWLLEGKRYYESERVNALLVSEGFEASTPATLEYERSTTEDSSATLNSNNIAGGRLRMDWTAIPGQLVPYASLAVFRDLEVGGSHFNTVPETILHPLVGVEWLHDGWSVLANVGYRNDLRDGNNSGTDRQLHGDVLAKIPLAIGYSIDLSAAAEWYRWGQNPVQQHDYVEAETSVAFQFKRIVTVTWFTDYSSNPLIDSVGNLAPNVYGAAELQVKPLPQLTLRAFYGAYKSGVRCAGGQCRVLPGFEGARISATATF